MNVALSLLTVSEVAERLRVSVASIYEMVRSGKLRSMRLGPNRGAIRIRPEELDRYLAAVEHQPPTTTKPARITPRVKLKHIRL